MEPITGQIVTAAFGVISSLFSGIMLFNLQRSKSTQDTEKASMAAKFEKFDTTLNDLRVTLATLQGNFVRHEQFAAFTEEMETRFELLTTESKAASTRLHERMDDVIPKMADRAALEKVRDRQHAHANMILRVWDRQNRCAHCNPSGVHSSDPLPPEFSP